jgi:hypothetical protein
MSVALVYPTRVVVAGKMQGTRQTELRVDPDFADRCQGRILYHQGKPPAACANAAQLDGWIDEEVRGCDAFLRALEDENLPASWADPYVSKPLDFQVEW